MKSSEHLPVLSVRVPLKSTPYDVLIGANLLENTAHYIKKTGIINGRIAIITDSNVAPLYAATVTESLTTAGFSPVTLIVPAGEKSKSMEQVSDLCDQLSTHQLDRQSAIIALGGGVVGDLAGFVAGIYYRGIPYIQIPTTIVSQVDSAVGGKTGVNSRHGKNLIGVFHQPKCVLADTTTLNSLPPREFHEGFAEIIKHAIIRDASLLEDILHLSADSLPSIIQRNVQIKANIVLQDEFETLGLRALLNFGHTIGHGIENAAGYGTFLHGEAIALGIIAACRLSIQHASFPQEHYQKVLHALQHFQLPVTLPSSIPTQAILDSLMKDKKFQQGKIHFVLSSNLGDAFLSPSITLSHITEAIENLRG